EAGLGHVGLRRAGEAAHDRGLSRRAGGQVPRVEAGQRVQEHPRQDAEEVNGAYPAARLVASKVHSHLKKHHESARKSGRNPTATIPDADVIETMVDAAFWASLKREEIYNPKISLAFLSSEQTIQPMLFERSLSLKPIALSRVAPAVERPGTHLGVW